MAGDSRVPTPFRCVDAGPTPRDPSKRGTDFIWASEAIWTQDGALKLARHAAHLPNWQAAIQQVRAASATEYRVILEVEHP